MELNFDYKKFREGLDERYGLDKFIEFIRKKTVPVHRFSISYYTGGVVLFLFIIQILTGFFLLFNYKAAPETAHDSIAYIMTEVPFGWLIRSIHHWSSNLMIFLLFIHFFSVLLLKTYRKPRELTWITGIVLLLCSLTMGYTGYILPWDDRAFFAVKVGTQMPESLPLIGEQIKVFLRGGRFVTEATLNRFFALHVGLIPWILAGVLGLHLLLIQIQGMSIPRSVEKEALRLDKKIEEVPFFPHYFLHDLSLWLLLLGILVTLAVLEPANIGPKANPLEPAPPGVKPDWFFLSIYQTLKIIPSQIIFISGETLGIVIIFLVVVFLAFIPFFDRASSREETSPLFTFLGLTITLYFVLMTIIGYFT